MCRCRILDHAYGHLYEPRPLAHAAFFSNRMLASLDIHPSFLCCSCSIIFIYIVCIKLHSCWKHIKYININHTFSFTVVTLSDSFITRTGSIGHQSSTEDQKDNDRKPNESINGSEGYTRSLVLVKKSNDQWPHSSSQAASTCQKTHHDTLSKEKREQMYNKITDGIGVLLL